VTGNDRTSDRAAEIRRLIAADRDAAEGVVGLLGRVCRIAARELEASGAGVTVMAEGGVRGLSAASDTVSEEWEDLQFTFGEGPCIDAFGARSPVLMPDLSGRALTRWPVYAPAVQEGGIRAVFAFPLQIGAARLGVMDVFRRRPGPLTETQLRTALLLADVTVETLLDRQEDSRRRGSAHGLVLDVGNRAQLFQAQGMVMVQLAVPLVEAMMVMRAYAFAESRRLDDVARDVVNRRLRFGPEPT
jgi:hypothetical protein